ncbi:hypothetical protein FORMB_10450 [Formosa sp. Hel1_33_131]|uniref:type IX secretion system protein PorG n=1 Tax=Formosa sp. Hel1_33_131 TaxID=1336794 RepID=UPI00084E2333|nr:DUF6089 family protein [Formosa sp. Hel1_33_131]AOR28093.1 hypothetical protein FORMB_10450 [Formosa sp. Hel1_33_131]
MKTTLTLICFLFMSSLSFSQIYEIGGFVGGSNFIGDVGSTQFVNPNKLAFGGLFKWNRSPRHSLRASLTYSTLSANDALSSDPRRKLRAYNFNADILEASVGIEFNFLDFDLHAATPMSTPYIYTGISMANHPNFYFTNVDLVSEKTRSNAYGIPITLGFKTTLTRHIILALEVGARYTFSDELDGSEPDTEELKKIVRFGNFNNNDWYVFSGFTLTYTFGRKPCYCYF